MFRALNSNPLRFNITKNVKSRRCHNTGKIKIDDVVFEKSAKSAKPELVPRKFCKA